MCFNEYRRALSEIAPQKQRRRLTVAWKHLAAWVTAGFSIVSLLLGAKESKSQSAIIESQGEQLKSAASELRQYRPRILTEKEEQEFVQIMSSSAEKGPLGILAMGSGDKVYSEEKAHTFARQLASLLVKSGFTVRRNIERQTEINRPESEVQLVLRTPVAPAYATNLQVALGRMGVKCKISFGLVFPGEGRIEVSEPP